MKNAFGLSIPDQLQDICTPSKCALLIYDMQVGIVPQIAKGAAILAQCQKLLGIARDKGFRVFFMRRTAADRRVGVRLLTA
jgi:biuret amidohydrolase